ncbi:MAG: hypothetical protein H0W69_10120 [Gemmatimonadaceae bacterium]|nr:hypothetical protein [Gemmatimonadaceae bacterium]
MPVFRYSAVVAVLLFKTFVASSVDAQVQSGRPTITVTDFDFGTVASQIAGDKGTRKRLEKMGVRDHQGFAAQLGVGAADLIVERLIETGAFRVLERKQLAAITQEQNISADSQGIATPSSTGNAASLTRARYIVTGSVTRLGFETKHLGGLIGRVAGPAFLYGLGATKQLTEVHLTARVVDTQTGEIVASFTGEGLSDKGWGITVFGMGGWGFGGGKAGSSGVQETAIGEATSIAARNIVERINQTTIAGR